MNVFDAVFSVSPDLYFQLNDQGVVEAYHALTSQDLILPPEEFLGRRVQEIMPADVGQQMLNAIQESLRTQHPVSLDYQLPIVGGSQHYEARFIAYAPRQVIAIVHNITARKQAEISLQESESQYRDLVENLGEAVFASDRDYRVVFANPRAEKLTGAQPGQLIGRTVISLFAPESASLIQHQMTERRQGRKTVYEAEIVRLDDGTRREVRITGVPRFDPEGGFRGSLAVAQDVTEHQQAQHQIQHLYTLERRARRDAEIIAEATVAITLSQSLDIMLEILLNYLGQLVDFDAGSILLVENSTQLVRRATRYTLSQPETGETGAERWAAQAHPLLQELLSTAQSQHLADIPAGAAQAWMPDAEHARCWLGVPLALEEQVVGICSLTKTSPNFFTAGHQRLAEGVAAQATAAIQNARLFEQVTTGQEQLRRLTQQVVLAQEQERQRVSRELHDEANQALVALMLNLDIVREELPPDSPTAHSLTRAIAQIDTTLHQIRLLAQDLRPPALDTIGLRAVLEDYCLDFAARTQLNIQYTSADLPQLSDTVSICLYRILQEALTNAAKHARPKHIRVSLCPHSGAIELAVEDDGRGFDPAADIHARGAGLLGIRERLALLNGHLELNSHPEHGTRLVARVPQ